MLKIDTTGEMGRIEASGSTDELIKDFVTAIASIARGMVQHGDIASAILLPTIVGGMLTDEEFIREIVLDDNFDQAIVSVTPEEGESDEHAEARAMMEAMQKFSKIRPIKVDGDYNIINDEEGDDE